MYKVSLFYGELYHIEKEINSFLSAISDALIGAPRYAITEDRAGSLTVLMTYKIALV